MSFVSEIVCHCCRCLVLIKDLLMLSDEMKRIEENIPLAVFRFTFS